MPESNTPSEFTYFISEKGTFLVVSFEGIMDRASASVLEKCTSEIMKKSRQRVVLNLQGIRGVQQPAIPAFVRLQAAIRKPSALRLCSLDPKVASLLEARAAIRADEVCKDLSSALTSFGRVAR